MLLEMYEICVYILPQLEIEKGAELTPVHLHLARLCGAVFIGTSLIWWFTRDTRDGTVPITLLTTRVFVSFTM